MKNLVFLLLLFQLSCAQDTNFAQTNYPNRHIGDIEYDFLTDKLNFLCYPEGYTAQYMSAGLSGNSAVDYKGEKLELEKIFYEKYNPKIAKKESGWIRIRFIVNCKGETDRFRLFGADESYKEKEFDTSITDQLMNITKNLDDWNIKTYESTAMDYYQYLIFKIENGEIKTILP